LRDVPLTEGLGARPPVMNLIASACLRVTGEATAAELAKMISSECRFVKRSDLLAKRLTLA
jgi:hypothetical protein